MSGIACESWRRIGMGYMKEIGGIWSLLINHMSSCIKHHRTRSGIKGMKGDLLS